jgi:hypothetical protein
MNKDDIIRMAREAECSETWGGDAFKFTVEELERFAALVAAAEAERISNQSRHIIKRAEARGAEAERAECARICDDEATRAGWNRDNDISINQTFWTGGEKLAFSCAEAIRARGNR